MEKKMIKEILAILIEMMIMLGCFGLAAAEQNMQEGEFWDRKNMDFEWDPVERVQVIHSCALYFENEGEIPDYTSFEDTPWAAYKDTIELIVIGPRITKIGKNAFAGLGKTVRVDFTGAPSDSLTIDEDAFNNSTAICRYYDSSWNYPSGLHGTITWKYLPYYYGLNNEAGSGLAYSAAAGWHFNKYNPETGSFIPYTLSSVEDVDETTYFAKYGGRSIELLDMPSEQEYNQVCNNWELNSGISFTGVTGAVSLTIPDQVGKHIHIDCASDVQLTITAEGDNRIQLFVRDGEVICNADVSQIDLESQNGDATPSSVTINGDVETLIVHGEWEPFTGSLNMTGTLQNGTFIGNGTIAIEGVSNEIPVNGLVEAALNNKTFENTSIIANGVPNSEIVQIPEDALALYDAYNYSVEGPWNEFEEQKNQWKLTLSSWELGTSTQPIYLTNYKPDFSEADIDWSKNPSITILNALGMVELYGSADGKGYYELSVQNSAAVINSPVKIMTVYGDSNVTINVGVEYQFEMSGLNNGTIILGENGDIAGAIRDRFRGWLGFKAKGPMDPMFSNGRLYVPAYKENEKIASLLPTTEEVTSKATGLQEGEKAYLDLSETNLGKLSPEEVRGLYSIVNIAEGNAFAVVDASMKAYRETEYGDISLSETQIDQTSSPLTIVVSDFTEHQDVSVIRLHENEDGSFEASALDATVHGEEISFSSDRFSKFVLYSVSEEPASAALRVGNKAAVKETPVDALGNPVAAEADSAFMKYSDSYYYKLYVDIPDGADTFQIGWSDELEAAEPDGWDTWETRWLSEDDGGRFFLSQGSESENITQDKVFIRINESDSRVFALGMEYDLTKKNGATVTPALSANEAPTLGSDCTLTWNAAGNADDYSILWSMPDGQTTRLDVSGDKTTVKLSELIPEEDLPYFTGWVGTYTIKMDAYANNQAGFAGDQQKLAFTIEAPEANSGLTMTCVEPEADQNGTVTLPLNQGARFEIHVGDIGAGLTAGDLYFVCGDNIDRLDVENGWAEAYWTRTDLEEQRTYPYNAYAKMWVTETSAGDDVTGGSGEGTDGEATGEAGGHWIYSNTIPVQVVVDKTISGNIIYEVIGEYSYADNDQQTPQIAIVPRDGMLSLKVWDLDGVDFFGAYLTEGNNGRWIADSHWITLDGRVDEYDANNRKYTIVNLPVAGCEAGKQYQLHVYAIQMGAPTKESDQKTTIQAGEKDGQDDFIINMQDSYVTGEPIRIQAYYEKAAQYRDRDPWIEIRVTPENDPTDEIMRDSGDPNGYWCDWLTINHQGSYKLTTLFCVENPEDKDRPTIIDSSFRLFEVTSNGAMPEAVITENVKPVMTTEESKSISISFKADGDPERVDVDFGRKEEWGEYIPIDHAERLIPNDEGIYTYQYTSTAVLAPGWYEIGIGTNKRGCEASFAVIRFLVMEANENPTGSVALTVTAKGQEMPVTAAGQDLPLASGTPVDIRVTVTGASEDAKATAVRIWNGDHWEYMKLADCGEGEDINEIVLLDWSFGSETTVLMAQATFDPFDEGAEYFGWETLNWTSSPAIRLVMRSDFALEEPKAEIGKLTETDEGTIFAALNAEESVTSTDALGIRIMPQRVIDEHGQETEEKIGEWYWVEIERLGTNGYGDSEWEHLYHIDWNAEDEDGIQIRIPAGTLTMGRYRIRVMNEQINYRQAESFFNITVTGEVGADRLIATLSRTTAKPNEAVTVFVQKAGARSVGVEVTHEGWNEPDRDEAEEVSSAAWTYRYSEPGTYTFTPYYLPENNDDLVTGPMLTLTISEGEEIRPVITAGVATAGEDFLITLGNLDHVSRWSAEVYDTTVEEGQDWNRILRDEGRRNQEDQISVTVPGESLTAGHIYQVNIHYQTEEVGYINGSEDTRFTAVSVAQDGQTVAVMTRRGEGTVSVNQRVWFNIEAPAGTKAALFFDGFNWQYQDKEDGDESLTFLFAAEFDKEGSHTVQIMTAAEKAMDGREESRMALNWIPGNDVTIEVTKIGTAGQGAMIGFEDEEDTDAVARGEKLKVRFTRDMYTEKYMIDIQDNHGNNQIDTLEIRAIDSTNDWMETEIPTIAIEPGDYWVQVRYHGMPGYLSTNHRIRCRITEGEIQGAALTVSLSSASGVNHEWVTGSAYMAGASYYQLLLEENHYGQASTQDWGRFYPRESGGASFSFEMHMGMTAVIIKAFDGQDQQLDTVSTPINVMTEGRLTLTLQKPTLVPAGEDLTFTVDGLENANWYWEVVVEHNAGSDEERHFVQDLFWSSNNGDSAGSFTIPANMLEVDSAYHIWVNGDAYGLEGGYAEGWVKAVDVNTIKGIMPFNLKLPTNITSVEPGAFDGVDLRIVRINEAVDENVLSFLAPYDVWFVVTEQEIDPRKVDADVITPAEYETLMGAAASGNGN